MDALRPTRRPHRPDRAGRGRRTRPPNPSNGGFRMQSTNHAADKRRHLSRHERQRQARAAAFSRRSMTVPIVPTPMTLATEELELIDRLVRRDRTAVSTALLAIAGIGAGEASRRAVLARIAE